ncbi:zinc finger and BTB domain-containing protein 38 isoform X1 [Poeciliopsis prolifica]|uniref:zinc finger and BTB domain-containing protein 38 isoform X1 n=2 Tax=Poeciliopsis prolifica TaxID=188132 RepID=UPI002413610C|nr:zinc finger and BTB domain-containing protein 38 isoform X1 [Poeciliopsis prolifica]XP_054884774.1 zinc finger and BTB domain-containing protein 38 isoform X1 [Poeciliopsis prolifica]
MEVLVRMGGPKQLLLSLEASGEATEPRRVFGFLPSPLVCSADASAAFASISSLYIDECSEPMHPNLMDSTHPSTVLSKLNEQRSQGLFCDVTIVVEDVKFRAHKNILAACSGYFRSTLATTDTCSSSQVLELMDLKSEVFACILNFIYSSKLTSLGEENRGGLAAAGRRLGISFLEKLADEEQQDERVSPRDSCANTKSSTTKKEASRREDTDSARGPRITNAFSITEMCPGNNPFTPLVQTDKQRQSPDVGHLPSNFPSISSINGNNETTHTLSEHSYAVNNSTEDKDTSQWDDRNVCKPAILHSKPLMYRNTGPLKKRHRLRGILGKSMLPAPADNTVTPVLSDGDAAAPVAVMTPPALFSEAETEKITETELCGATDSANTELGPPPLSPHPEDSISVYSCEHCPEIFSNKALLTIHSEVHKKHFDTRLFCKFCHRKFIHLKRLHNHERLCPKTGRGPPKLDAREISAKEVEQHSDDRLNMESSATQPPSADLPSPNMPELTEVNLTERLHEEKTVRQRRYNCSVCKRVYVTLSSLRRHENVHSWQRAYPCHYCNKVFALAEYRTKHEIWHTGERRYQCIFCLETFMTYYILKNHQKSFHGIDPNLAVRKKSANGGLKASVYPIKLYRLLPMKFRKRQYKTYSQTYSESGEKGDSSSLDNSSLIPPFEENSLLTHPDTTSFPLTFMATTKMVSPVMPRICFDKPCNQVIDQNLNSEQGKQISTENEAGDRGSPFSNCDSIFSSKLTLPNPEPQTDKPPVLMNSEHITHTVPFFNSLSTVKKLGELSASAKRVEEMTKEILQSSTKDLMRDKVMGTKTETYIAKPACQGPSLDSDTKPLCQITVKIGNEAIIRRKIKGSKLFPRKKRKTRERNEEQAPSQCSPLRENTESPRLRLRPEAVASTETCDDTNDCDTADQLWRPYYSYKAKKKRKKFRYKHRNALFHPCPELSIDRTGVTESHFDRTHFPTEESSSGASIGPKHSLSRNYSPRPTYNCDICDSSFITETGLKAHVIGSHPYFCRTCGKQGPPGEAPSCGDYICNSCMENGSCFDNTPRSPNQEKKYRCSFCPQRFVYLATKRSHEKKHQETNDESPTYDTFTSCSTYSAQPRECSKQDTTKREDSGNQEDVHIKGENIDEADFTTIESKPKIKDVSDLSTKNSPSPYVECLPTLTPSKMKQKVVKKRIKVHHPMRHTAKKQAYDRDSDPNKKSTGPRMNNLANYDKSSKPIQKTDSESNGAYISIHKPEKWVCKEEPFF